MYIVIVSKVQKVSTPVLPKNLHGLGKTSFYLVLGDGTNRVMPLPYEIKAGNDGLRVCFPDKVVTDTYIFTSFIDNLIFGSSNGLGNRQVVAFDQLSVTMRWTNGDQSYMEVPMVRGMAYVTIFYNNMVPTISTIHAILNVNGQSFSPGTEFSGQKFDFEMNNGQKWNLYTSLPITIIFTVQGITFKQSYTGSVRVAINTGPSVSTILDQHANKIPIGKLISLKTAKSDTFN